jgi:uncharacterized membrane protein
MDERTRTWVMVGISAVVLLAIALMIILIEGFNLWSVVMLVTIVALALVALALAARSLREMRSGLPLQDERSISLGMRAGNRAFYVSMYLILFMAVAFVALEDQQIAVSSSELLFVVVALMGSIHIIFSTYYNRKGRVA